MTQENEREQQFDDEEGNYVFTPGEVFVDRYRVLGEILGKGAFGIVLLAHDLLEEKEVAIKIIKNKKAFWRQGQSELTLLKLIRQIDKHDKYFVLKLLDHFVHCGHLCIVMERLSYNLYDLLQSTSFTGVSLSLIRKFARQILTGLYFFTTSNVRIVHCDLKPENIMLCNPTQSKIKIVDFGSSCHDGETMYTYIQSRYYRSPEVLMELDYSYPIDVWSLGCILVELHTGRPLFRGANELDQMAKICALKGLPPIKMVMHSRKARFFFKFEKKMSSDITYSIKDQDLVGAPHDLSDVLEPAQLRRKGQKGHNEEDYIAFQNLIEQMLHYDPHKRITPLAALHHTFFKMET